VDISEWEKKKRGREPRKRKADQERGGKTLPFIRSPGEREGRERDLRATEGEKKRGRVPLLL